MLLLFTLVLFTLQFTTPTTAMGNTTKPGCQTQCGYVTVPYPFGIGDKSCFLDKSFELTCNSNFTPAKLFTGNIQVFEISESEMRISNPVAYNCYKAGIETQAVPGWTSLGRSLTFSQKNVFTVVGCDDFAVITGTNEGQFTGGCLGQCTATNYASGQCPGVGCCQTSIPKGLKYFNTTLFSFENHTKVESFNLCGFAFLGEESSFQFRGECDMYFGNEFYNRTRTNVPIVVDWVIGDSSVRMYLVFVGFSLLC